MTRNRFDADSYLPITPAMFQVLVALADGDKHGYAVIKEVRRRTNDKVSIGAGTLYAIVKRLLDGGLIIECDERPDPSLDDERRRYYRLTKDGREVALAEARRLEEVLDQAKAKLLVKKPRPV